VRLFGDLVRYSPDGKDAFFLDLPCTLGGAGSATTGDLLRGLKIPEAEVWMITVGGVQLQGDRVSNYVLRDGDEVMVFAPVMGG